MKLSVDPETIPLATLLRHIGETTNFKIVKVLSDNDLTPGELAENLDVSRSAISSQLSLLRKLGFVEYDKEGLNHRYFVPDSLPSLQHELLIDLIKIDESDPEKNPFEDEDSVDVDEELREKIQEKKSERFRKKLSLLASYWGHPGLTSAMKSDKKLRNEIDRLDREIEQLLFS